MVINMEIHSFVSIAELSKEKILYLLEMAHEFEKRPNRKILDGKVIATLFFEPSTRTRLSLKQHLIDLVHALSVLLTPKQQVPLKEKHLKIPF